MICYSAPISGKILANRFWQLCINEFGHAASEYT